MIYLTKGNVLMDVWRNYINLFLIKLWINEIKLLKRYLIILVFDIFEFLIKKS